MSQNPNAYNTYFSAPFQVGKGVDNVGAYQYLGDVVLSQNIAIPATANASTSATYCYLPIGSDLLSIDLTVVNGTAPTAGVISIQPQQADGTGPGAITTVTLSTTNGSTPVTFSLALSNVYLIGSNWRLAFWQSTAVAPAGANPIIAEVRYCIRQ